MTNASLKNKKRDTLLAVLDQADDFLLQEKRNIEKINKKMYCKHIEKPGFD